MYLSKLTLHGFKSFADQTELHFSPGITAIVGPNGCGKSNIVDAVRWVVGEQRASVLRSDKMNDVIFNGTSRRRALGMSEVHLTVENNRGVLPTEYSEVSIGRRLFRSGDSEYLMNDVQTRLKDVQDLFMDTGMGADAYSVIELKMIEEIISDSTEDRRHMFEEAAGISRYKQRRRQALRKLEQTQVDLDRVRDLTDEVAKNVRRLKRQAKRAGEYTGVKSRLDELELALAQSEYNRLCDKQRELTQGLNDLSRQLESDATRITTAEAQLERLKKQIVDREQTLTGRGQVLADHLENAREKETLQRLEKERLENALRDRERTQQALEENRKRSEDIAQTLERLAEQTGQALPLRDEAEATLEEARRAREASNEVSQELRAALQERRQHERAADETAVEHRRAVDRLAGRIELLEKDRERLLSEGEELRDSDASAQLEEAAQTRELLLAKTQEARDELARVKTERDAIDRELEEALTELRETERRRDARAAEVELLSSLVSSYEDFSDAVQFLAASKDWAASPMQTVSDVTGCDPAHQLALQSALGPLAECVLVADEKELRAAMYRLRTEEHGRATFLVRSRLNSETPASPDVEGAAALRPLVRTSDPAFDPLVDHLLRDCYLVDTLEEAGRFAATNSGRFYARSGEWCDDAGLAHGGSTRDEDAAPARFHRREQLAAARKRLVTLENTLAERQAEAESARSSRDALSITSVEDAAASAELELSKAEKKHDRIAFEQEQLDKRKASMDARLEELRSSLAEMRAALEDEVTALASAERALQDAQTERGDAEKAFGKAEVSDRSAVAAHNDAHVAAVQARNQLENLQRERERNERSAREIEERRAQHSGHLGGLEDNMAGLRRRIESLEQELSKLRTGRDELEARVNEARAALTETKASVSDLEKSLRGFRSERETHIREENELNVRQAQVQTRTEDLLDELAEDYDRRLDADPVSLEATFEEAPARDEVGALRRKIKRIGIVNPLALEQYEEEQDRLEFLTTQRDDLEQAEDTLLETINEINQTATERFRKTFEAVRTNFQDLFGRLFRGDARADLILEDPSNPLDSPIVIEARPSGKRPSVLSQLSSGEKTLTAIALLFGIYLVKPSPFCILDEVDAPLDDMNVERFMHLLKEFDDKTQFIIVTHNKLTMEAADRLYGITMQEQGVSQLVGVHFDEAVAMVA